MHNAVSDPQKATPNFGKNVAGPSSEQRQNQPQTGASNRRRSPADVDMRATYVAKPTNAPAGINMEDFVMQDNNTNAKQQDDVDSKRLVEIINEVS